MNKLNESWYKVTVISQDDIAQETRKYIAPEHCDETDIQRGHFIYCFVADKNPDIRINTLINDPAHYRGKYHESTINTNELEYFKNKYYTIERIDDLDAVLSNKDRIVTSTGRVYRQLARDAISPVLSKITNSDTYIIHHKDDFELNNDIKNFAIIYPTIELNTKREKASVCNAIHQILHRWVSDTDVLQEKTIDAGTVSNIIQETDGNYYAVPYTVQITLKKVPNKAAIKLYDKEEITEMKTKSIREYYENTFENPWYEDEYHPYLDLFNDICAGMDIESSPSIQGSRGRDYFYSIPIGKYEERTEIGDVDFTTECEFMNALTDQYKGIITPDVEKEISHFICDICGLPYDCDNKSNWPEFKDFDEICRILEKNGYHASYEDIRSENAEYFYLDGYELYLDDVYNDFYEIMDKFRIGTPEFEEEILTWADAQ